MIDTTGIFSQPRPSNHKPMKTKIVLFLAVALTGPLVSQPIFADVTYEYTGNPFTDVSGIYTTSDRVTGMLTLAHPLAANMSLDFITPISFTFTDGHITLGNGFSDPFPLIKLGTGPTGAINAWNIQLTRLSGVTEGEIDTLNTGDHGEFVGIFPEDVGNGSNSGLPGTWTLVGGVPDTGSTLSLMTLTLMALSVAARQFKRAAA